MFKNNCYWLLYTNTLSKREIKDFINLISAMRSFAISLYKITFQTESKHQLSSWFYSFKGDGSPKCSGHIVCLLAPAFPTSQFSQHELSTLFYPK